jgi:Ca2+-binding RTX toxin-like protein
MRSRRSSVKSPMQAQTLETRMMLSATASFNNGILTVASTATTGRIVITQSSDHKVVINGAKTNFATQQVRTVAIVMGDGGTGPGYIVDLRGVNWGAKCIVVGGSRNDTIYGSPGVDEVRTFGGNDRVYGGNGNDVIQLGTGNDVAYGGNGNDRMYSEGGTDTLYGDGGDDFLYGGNQNDILIGGVGNDTLVGNGGNDVLRGDDGNDVLIGGLGADNIAGGNGEDLIVGSQVSWGPLQTAWFARRPYAERARHALIPTNTPRDEADRIAGNAGLDWFVVSANDQVLDKVFSEVRTLL